GEFGIATRMVQKPQAERAEGEPEEQVVPGATMIYKPPPPSETQAVSPEELGVEAEKAKLVVDGTDHELDSRRVTIGRSKDCDIQVADPNASRHHAELVREGVSYWIVDLDSTNGIEVNGHRERRARLEHGDRITIGSTELVYQLERS